MRKIFDTSLDKYRVRIGEEGSKPVDGWKGKFIIPGPCGKELTIRCDTIFEGWEHVSVEIRNRTPNWAEMCYVKSIFWGDDETVIQFHPREGLVIDKNPLRLHLWKIEGKELLMPGQKQ